jgi:DNA repair protein RadC
MEMKYAYSLKTEMVKEVDFPYDNRKISQASDVAVFVRKIQDSDVEKLICIFLNANNKIIGVHITVGTVNCAMPFAREIFKHALLHTAAALVLVHNHPSNNLSPSPEDKKFTSEVVNGGKIMGIRVLDHIIIGETGFFSFADEGILN